MKAAPGTALRGALVTLVVLALLAAAAAAAFVRSGWYDVSANSQHLRPVYLLLQTAMHYSVRRRAAALEPPPNDARRQEHGLDVYLVNCLPCHGAPGIAPDAFANSMQPLPGPLVDASRRWQPRELYWITRNGIKMSGMPAWEYRLSEDDLWAVVAFLEQLPNLSVPQFDELARQVRPGHDGRRAAAGRPKEDATHPAGAGVDAGVASEAPDAGRGLVALHQHACNSCHLIPGVTGSDVHVGPPLAGIASRKLIAGSAPNTEEQMVRWLRDPKSIDRWTAMPDLGVSERAARDMAAYLATLR